MPLSKARMKERKRQDRLVKPKLVCLADVKPTRILPLCPIVQPMSNLDVRPSVIPKLPWYAGAGDHFGEVKSKYYAKQFFSNLFDGRYR